MTAKPLDLAQFEFATRGPWYCNGRTVRHLDGTPGGEEIAVFPEYNANASLTASAPALLAECMRQREQIQVLREALAALDQHAKDCLLGATRLCNDEQLVYVNADLMRARAALAKVSP